MPAFKAKTGSWAVIAFGLSLSLAVWPQVKAEEPVRVREVSLRDSLRRVLQEKEELKEELRRAVERGEEIQTRLNLHIQRIRVMNNQINALQTELVETKKSNREKEAAIAALREQLSQKETELAAALVPASGLVAAPEAKVEAEAEVVNREPATSQEELLARQNRELEKKNGALYYNLGNQFFRRGEYREAARNYRKALGYLPDDPDSLYNLAVIYDYYFNDFNLARDYYRRYLDKNPESSDALAIKERLVQRELKARVGGRESFFSDWIGF